MVTIREAQEADDPRIVEVGNAVFPEYPGTLDDLRHERARLRAGGYATAMTVAFLVRRGFRETMRTWENRLELRRFDPSAFLRYLDRARDAGVVITTLAEERARDPETLRRVHALHTAVARDIPSPIPYTPLPFEQFLHLVVESPTSLPDGHFLARVGEDYAGESTLVRSATDAYVYHGATGVLPATRGRGIAMALKVSAALYARAQGYPELRTWNEENNQAILVINERLGFARQPAWLTLERHIAPATRVDGARDHV
ncbi:MAG: hypothetical protein HY355_04100 [Armatimonadetes bacterium]|nr:hypothetical protein [Armatimonadota bacterium]